jgi:hypothetical protein
MPRIEIRCHATLRDGANVLHVRTCDISQGGVKIECETILPRGADIMPRGADVVVILPGLEPQAGVACWIDDGFIGVTFNCLLPLDKLVSWLHTQHELQRGAA